ncbi:MAG: MFS transporter [Cyanobacteria bacterium CAN_BIN43]|nr:MFS transporter [Cyanobacteria bacterium CAN_BIN43]
MVKKLPLGLPPLDRQVWILIIGRLLSNIGTGFVLFSAPVFFVNQVGLSAAAVGFAIGSESITGVIGRILGGSLADSPRWGRRKTLMMAVVFSAIADFVLAVSNDFPSFLAGNLLMGVGVGLYWPSAESMVADLAPLEYRNEAFALNRLADSLGLSLGVVIGGAWIAATGAYRALFWVDAISFLVFLVVAAVALRESRPVVAGELHKRSLWQGWGEALGDRTLKIFVLVNILFTTYLALVSSTLPIYFTNFVSNAQTGEFSSKVLSALFAGYVALAALTQLPIARFLKRWSHPQALTLSALLWAVGFGVMWLTGTVAQNQIAWAAVGLGVMAIATVSYMPAASSIVTGLAPAALRGVYLSINSLCWATGYFIGPAVGGWAMNHDESIAVGFWIAAASSVAIAVTIAQVLNRRLSRKEKA